jgi:ATP-dependent Clp protease protease subunit
MPLFHVLEVKSGVPRKALGSTLQGCSTHSPLPQSCIVLLEMIWRCGISQSCSSLQANELQQSRSKLDLMFSAFTGQPLETVQTATERDRFFSAAEACDFGLIDDILETEY